jgi:hypothetical protein
VAALSYLELCKKVIQKCVISGSPLTTVQGLTGEAGRVAAWVDEAYTDIQVAHQDWLFLRGDFQFNTQANKGKYTPAECGITDFGDWKKESMRLYLTSVGVRGETFLEDKHYDEFRDYYLFGNTRLVAGRPLCAAIAPDFSLNLGLMPNDIYTVVGEYYKTTFNLSADSDLPVFPARFHMIIVYRAMMMYGLNMSASDVYQEGEREYSKWIRRLESAFLPEIQMG